MQLKRSRLEDKAYLVIDDFGDMRSLIKNMLMSCMATDISVSHNGADAIGKMEQKRFDVILCDYNLGSGKDGQQVLEEARHRHLIGLGTVFIMITAENTRDMVMGAVEYEPDSYLTKPFNKDLLKARLDKQLAKKENLSAIDQALEKRDYAMAIALLKQKIADAPPNVGELRKLMGEVCLNAGEVETATSVYQEALAVREMPWARLGLGKSLFLAKHYEQAREILQSLVDENETYTMAYDWLARCHKCLDRLDDAQTVLQRAAALSPKAVIRQRALGELALITGDDSLAEKAFGTAVKLGRHSVYKHPSIYGNLAKVTARSRGMDEGFGVLRNMEREFRNSDEARFFHATAKSVMLESSGDHEGAKQAMQEAREQMERQNRGMQSDFALEMAKTYCALGEMDSAEALLKQTIRNNHSNEELIKEVAATMDKLEFQFDSGEYISQVRKEIVRLNNRGVELARAGDTAAAIELFEEAVEGMPGNIVVNLNTARVLIMNMETEGVNNNTLSKARLYLERVKKIDPDNPTLRKLLVKLKTLIDGG